MSDEMSGATARAIDEWIVGRLTQAIDTSYQRACDRLNAAAHEAVTEGMGTGMGREEYEAMWIGRSGDRYEWTAVVGLYVADAIEEMIIDEMPDDMWRMILIDILTLHSSTTRDVLGEHYLPEPDDVEWPTVECGVCGGDDGGCTPDECAYEEAACHACGGSVHPDTEWGHCDSAGDGCGCERYCSEECYRAG